MKLFLKKISLLLLLISVINVALFFLLSTENWLEEEKNNRHKISKISLKNKMLVIAGSSMGSSFDSDLVSKKINKQVYNASFSVSHSSSFILNYIKDNVSKGDVVVYGAEYEHYYNSINKLSSAHVTSIYINRSLFKYLEPSEKLEFILNVPRMNFLLLYRKLRVFINADFFKKVPLTKRGDYVGRYLLNKTWTPSNITRYDKFGFNHNINNLFRKKLIETAKTIEKRGAFFYVTFPPIAASSFDNRLIKDIAMFYRGTKIKLIGSPEDFILDDSLILDHAYHATIEGVKKRSEVFITKYEELLNN